MAQKRLSEAAKKRLKAGRLLLAGKGCAEVALAVGVARQTGYTWKRLLDEGGIDALREVPERGRPAQLEEHQLAAVRAAVLQNLDSVNYDDRLRDNYDVRSTGVIVAVSWL